MTTATGKVQSAATQLDSVDVHVVGTQHRASLIVVPLGTYDVILGTPWFVATKPHFDWQRWTCNGHAVYSQGGRSVGRPGRTERRLQSVVVGAAHEAVMGRLLKQYSDVFAAKLPTRAARKDVLVHSFAMVDGAKPTRDGERRQSPEEMRLAREMVAEGEASGIIEASVSEWCSQLVMVVKKDQHGVPTGKPRFAVDYRRVNALMKKDAHPLPLPDVMFAQLTGAVVFSKLDLTKGFYQIELDPACREQLAFSTPDGLRQWTVMPFGVANAPATFQREMQRVFRMRLHDSVLVYIDDILVFSRRVDEHAEHVEWVLQQLRANGYYANPDKCEFFQERVSFLGHVISADGVAVQQHKVDAVAQWPTPQSVSDVRRFLGLTSYYRRFVSGFSGLAAPLSDLTRKDTAFVWGDKEAAAFAQLKAALQSAPVLLTPDNAKPYTLHTDASGYAVGATLSQQNADGVLQPVAFLSKKMSAAQRNYPVHEWELLAVMEALKAWRCFLYGAVAPIDMYTDHHSLQWISTQPHLSARQSRWVETLQDYTFKVHHLAGAKNGAADALSRRSDYEAAHAAEEEARRRAGESSAGRPRLRLEPAVLDASESAAESASGTSTVMAPALMDDIRRLALTDEEYYVPLLASAEHLGLQVRDGLVYSPAGLLYIPKDDALRTTLMREVHDAPTGGHLGREKTFARLTARVYWRGVYNAVRDYVRSCVSCAQSKASQRVGADLLRPLPIPARRWETLSMDFVGPLPRTAAGHDFLLVVVDKFSKACHLIACAQTVTAADVAQLVYDGVVRLHGFPEAIISDRDTRFTSRFWQALWKLSGTQLKMSSSYHPQTDGQTESVNRVAQDILRAYVERQQPRLGPPPDGGGDRHQQQPSRVDGLHAALPEPQPGDAPALRHRAEGRSGGGASAGGGGGDGRHGRQRRDGSRAHGGGAGAAGGGSQPPPPRAVVRGGRPGDAQHGQPGGLPPQAGEPLHRPLPRGGRGVGHRHAGAAGRHAGARARERGARQAVRAQRGRVAGPSAAQPAAAGARVGRRSGGVGGGRYLGQGRDARGAARSRPPSPARRRPSRPRRPRRSGSRATSCSGPATTWTSVAGREKPAWTALASSSTTTSGGWRWKPRRASRAGRAGSGQW